MNDYLEITSIEIPEEATIGDSVVLTVKVTNVSDELIGVARIAFSGDLEGELPWQQLEPGEEGTWEAAFTMPSDSITFDVMAQYYGVDGEWHTDDTRPSSIEAIEPPLQSVVQSIMPLIMLGFLGVIMIPMVRGMTKGGEG